MVRYVSWNEFVHQMLARGEVDRVLVRPDINAVTVYLQEGAVIKGKKVSTCDARVNEIREIALSLFEVITRHYLCMY